MTKEELHKKNRESGRFTCHNCKHTYEINLEHDPLKEAKELFGDLSKRDDQVVLCDDCFNDFMGFYNKTKD